MTGTPTELFPALVVETDLLSTQFDNKMAVLDNGDIVISTYKFTDEQIWSFRIVDADTQAITDVDFDPGTPANNEPLQVIAVDGGFLAVWDGWIGTTRTIRAQFFDNDGNTVGGVTNLVSDTTPGVEDPNSIWNYTPNISLDDLTLMENGDVVVAFTLASEEDAHPQSGEFDVKGVIVEIDDGILSLRTLPAEKSSTANIQQVSAVFDIENGSGSSSDVALREIPGGGFFSAGREEVSTDGGVSSETQNVIRVFDESGVETNRIETEVSLWFPEDRVVALGGDRFAILSSSFPDEAPFWQISFDVIDGTGARITETAFLGQGSFGANYQMRLVQLADGTFAAIWYDQSVGSPSKLFIQRIAPDGSTIGDPVEVSDGISETSLIYFPDVALDSLGNLIIVWNEANNLGETDGNLQSFSIPEVFSGGIEIGTENADTQTGTWRDELLIGFDGDDFQKSKGGDDMLRGGRGDDNQRGNSGNDTIVGGPGNDVQVGGGDNDVLIGGLGEDVLRGKSGEDELIGGLDKDILNGGSSDDILIGGLGGDIQKGGLGNDTFVYNSIEESGLVKPDRDLITDFEQGADMIDLSAIDAAPSVSDDAFAFIGTAGFSGTAGELRYELQPSGNTAIEADVTGDGVADMRILLSGAHDLLASDFVL